LKDIFILSYDSMMTVAMQHGLLLASLF